MKLYHINSVYPLIQSLYGIDPNPEDFEDLAITAWELIGNKHTRLYRYVADTKNNELLLPCNVDQIEAVHIPLVDAQYTSNKTDFGDFDSFYTENYIDAWKFMEDPFDQRGKLVKYKEGGDRLFFSRDYKHVMVIYQGVLVNDEDGLPMINNKEQNAIAAFIAWRIVFKDSLVKRDKASIELATILKEEWLRKCNAARIPEHVSQNEMNATLDVKYRWDRKMFGKSLIPII